MIITEQTNTSIVKNINQIEITQKMEIVYGDLFTNLF